MHIIYERKRALNDVFIECSMGCFFIFIVYKRLMWISES